MQKNTYLQLCFSIVLLSDASLLLARPATDKTTTQTSISTNALRGSGMGFIENKGQVVDMNNNLRLDILFKGDGGGMNIYIRKTGVSYVMTDLEKTMKEISDAIESMPDNFLLNEIQKKQLEAELLKNKTLKTQRIDMEFEGANTDAPIETMDQVEGYTNYYYAHCPNGFTHVNSYNRVIQKNIYPYVDVIYYGNKLDGLKYDIVVRPGGNPQDVRIKYKGADDVEVVNNTLKVRSSLGILTEELPRVYQNINGKIVDLKAQYILKETTLNFKLSNLPDGRQAFNPNYPLVIDPWITYYGGTGTDNSHHITTDNIGSVLVTGWTSSTNFPVTAGAFQTSLNTPGVIPFDAFVLKFNSGGGRLWATYYGGSHSEGTYGNTSITSDGGNNVIISGSTSSSNFPVTNGAFQTLFGGGGGFIPSDAYIVKFDSNGSRLWATFYGGTDPDASSGIATDASDNIVITGSTSSANFPVTTASGYQQAFGGSGDGFVVKFAANGNRLWATCYGGSGIDAGQGIACDNASNIIITGFTASNNFPVTTGIGYQQTYGGGNTDAFIVKFDSNNNRLWASYYGGSLADSYGYGHAIVTDSSDDIIIMGLTASTNFPVTPGVGYQQAYGGGGWDLFVVRFDSNGNRIWAAYLGTGFFDMTFGHVIDVDPYDNIYILWEAEDKNPGKIFPCAFQKTFGGGSASSGIYSAEDQIITKFSKGNMRICDTYLGGGTEDDLDGAGGIACFGGFIYVTAATQGSFPVTPGAFQTQSPGGDFYIAKLCGLSCGNPYTLTGTLSSNVTSACPNIPINFSSTHNISLVCDTTSITYLWSFTGASISTSSLQNPGNISWSSPGTYNVSLKIITLCDTLIVDQPNYITINPCGFNVQAVGGSACSGSCKNIIATASSGTAPYTYNWSNGATGQNISVCPTITTTYTVIVTDAGSMSSADTATLFIPSALSAVPSTLPISCNGGGNGSATVNPSGGTGPYTYSWSNTQITATASGLSAATYTLTLTDALGCSTYTVVNLTEPLAISLTTATATANCNQGSGSAIVNPSGGTAPFTYIWSNNSTSQQISNLSSATYSVIVTDNNGCAIDTTVTVGNMPGVTAQSAVSTSASCFGTCNGMASVSGTGGTNPYTYQWSSASGGSGGTNSTASNLCATAYSATITDAGGCFSTTNFIITEPTPMQLQSTASHVLCNGSNTGNASVNVTGGTSPYTYTWSLTSGGSTNQQINNLTAGNYTVSITDNNNCSTDTIITITEPVALSYTVSTTSETCGQNDGTATLHLTGGTPGYYFFWSVAGNDSTITNQASGTYTINAQDNNGCTVQTTITISNTGNPVTLLQQPYLCMGNSYTLPDGSITNTSGIYSYTLNTIAGCDSILIINLSIISSISTADTQNICSGQSALIHGISHDTTGIYTQTFFAAGGCDSTSSVTLFVDASPTANAGNDSTILAGQTVVLSASGGASGTGAYSWSTGQTTTTISQQPTTTTTYILTVTDNNGCASIDTITIFVNTPCDDNTQVFVPNSFSPNEDGQNDVLQLYPTGIPETLYFAIYNRWGEKVFESEELSKSWDGTYRSKPSDTAVFTWVLKITCKGNSKENIRTGTINLMR